MAIRQQSQILTKTATILSSSQEDVPTHVERILKECGDLRYALSNVKEKMVMRGLSDIPQEQKDVLLFEDGLDAKVMRNVVNELVKSHTGICGVFSGDDASGYQYIIGSSTVDCRELAGTLREKLNAKGGGSAQMIQGTLSVTEKEIRATCVC